MKGGGQMNKQDLVAKIAKLKLIEEDRLIRIVTECVDNWHRNDKPRQSDGSPFGDHPREACSLILDLMPLPIYVPKGTAAHDAKESRNPIEEIERKVGDRAAFLVEGMTEDPFNSGITGDLEGEEHYFARKHQYHEKFIHFWGTDHYLIFVKLADTYHNLHTMDGFKDMRKVRFMDQARFYINFYKSRKASMTPLYTYQKQEDTVEKWIRDMEKIIHRNYSKCAGACCKV